MKFYLECKSWIKQLRNIALENQKKVLLDPEMFIKGIEEKKFNIYQKYFKILKDVIELMKVVDLKKVNRYNMISESVEVELVDICSIVKMID